MPAAFAASLACGRRRPVLSLPGMREFVPLA
jgi:hypothetical protein